MVLSGDGVTVETTAQPVSGEVDEMQANLFESSSPSIPESVHSGDEWMMKRNNPARTGSTTASGPTDSAVDLNGRYDGGVVSRRLPSPVHRTRT